MLMNDSKMLTNMSDIRAVLNRNPDANVSAAVKELKTPAPPENHRQKWSDNKLDNSSVAMHFDYSGAAQDEMVSSSTTSKSMLVILLGEGSYDDFEDLMDNRGLDLEKEVKSLIGTKALGEYAKKHQGFEKSAIDVDVYEIDNIMKLGDDIDPNDYFSVYVLGTTEDEDLAKGLMDWFSDKMSNANNTVSMFYSLSNLVSKNIAELDENVASSIAASWLCAVKDLSPQYQLDTFFQAIIDTFHASKSTDNAIRHCKSIMLANFNNAKEPAKSEDEESIFSSCNLTTCGHYYPRRFYGDVLGAHLDAVSSLRNLALPAEFLGANPRTARDKWIDKNVEILANDVDEGLISVSASALLGLHEYFNESQSSIPDGETREQRLQRWATKKGKVDGQKVRNAYKDKRRRQIYGGTSDSSQKIEQFSTYDIFDELNNSSSESRNFAVNSSNWNFFRRLYLICEMHRYSEDTDYIDQHLIHRYELSRFRNVKDQINKNLLLELFIDFKNNGGVI